MAETAIGKFRIGGEFVYQVELICPFCHDNSIHGEWTLDEVRQVALDHLIECPRADPAEVSYAIAYDRGTWDDDEDNDR